MSDLTNDELVTLYNACEELAKSTLYARNRTGCGLDWIIGPENRDYHAALALRTKIHAELERRKAAK